MKEEGKGDGADTKEGGKEDTPSTKKKESKKKVKLELTDDQKFVDGNDVSYALFLVLVKTKEWLLSLAILSATMQ